MRFKKLAGVAIGALVTGALVVPLSSPASAAPVVLTGTQQLSCAFGNFDIAYPAEVEVTVDGTDVSATLSDIPPTGMPDFLKVHATAATVDATIDGESVELTGSVTYDAPITGNPAIGMPDVAGTRAGAGSVSAFALDGIEVVMSVQAYGPSTSPSSMTCSPVAPSEPEPVLMSASQAFACTWSSFAMPYTVDTEVTVDGADVSATLSNKFAPGMPAFLQVSRITTTVGVSLDGESVSLESVSDYSPALPGNSQFDLVDAVGVRTGAGDPAVLSIDSLGIVMVVGGSDYTVNCTIPVVVEGPESTTTGLTANSPAPNTVALAATVSPVAAGTVKFFEGDTKVGEQSVTAGVASLALNGVTAGVHTYTAEFVPDDVDAFAGSTSGAAAVTVADPVVVDPGAVSGSQAFACTWTEFAMPYTVSTSVTADGQNVTATLSNSFAPGMPAFLSVSRINASLGIRLNGESLALQSVSDYSPALPGNSAFTLANAVGTRTNLTAPAGLSIDSLSFALTVGGASYPVSCTVATPGGTDATATTTTLAATSPSANTVTLAATVSPAAAGTVQFFDGDTKVGEQIVAAGAASLTLPEVPAGVHTYTAEFVPTDAQAFAGSTSAAATVTVGGDVVVEPEVVETATGLTVVSAAANAVNLTATVTPADAAGAVEFLEGTTVVGTVVVASGAASLPLSEVAAGEHTYSARFVPADETAYAGSTASPVTVIVSGPPEEEEPPPAQVAAATKAKVSKAKYAAKAKKATIKIKVTSATATPHGKVKIVVKVGNKLVVTKTVKVNGNGVAKLVLKKGKLKKKGKYKITAQYAGNKKFKKSSAKGNFKVK